MAQLLLGPAKKGWKVTEQQMWYGGAAALLLVALVLVWYFSGDSSASVSERTLEKVTATQKTSTLNDSVVQAPRAVVPLAPVVPERSPGIAGAVEGIPSATRFNAMMKATGVESQVNGLASYTLFVPTDAAFNMLVPGTITGLTALGQQRVIQHHVIPGTRIDVKAISSGSVGALSGEALNFDSGLDGTARVNGAAILQTITTGNGIIYLIDRVLLPPQRLM